jgi:hypothetical protein
MTRDDKELLELAAKAAGIEVWFSRMSDGKGGVIEPCHRTLNGETVVWNPLDDDGDALRLAVKLEMTIDTDYNGGVVAGNINIGFDEPEYGYQEGMGKKDLYAATRRAIVQTAAKVGRKMK